VHNLKPTCRSCNFGKVKRWRLGGWCTADYNSRCDSGCRKQFHYSNVSDDCVWNRCWNILCQTVLIIRMQLQDCTISVCQIPIISISLPAGGHYISGHHMLMTAVQNKAAFVLHRQAGCRHYGGIQMCILLYYYYYYYIDIERWRFSMMYYIDFVMSSESRLLITVCACLCPDCRSYYV